MTPLHLSCGDIIEVPNHTRGTDLYHVTAICIGAVGFDSMVELIPITQGKGSSASAHKANTLVPLRMLEAGVAAGVFTHQSV